MIGLRIIVVACLFFRIVTAKKYLCKAKLVESLAESDSEEDFSDESGQSSLEEEKKARQ